MENCRCFDEKSLDVAFDAISIAYHLLLLFLLAMGRTMISTNVNGTRNVVSAALKKNVKKLCFVSSIAACGPAEWKNGYRKPSLG